jgi:sulfur carrier protein
MLVEVKLFATYRQGRFKVKKMELAEGALLRDVLEPLGLPDEPPKILMVNGISADEAHKLSDNDVIAIFPMIAGG